MVTASKASGHGIATVTDSGKVLEVWYPEPKLAPLSGEPSAQLKALAGNDETRGVKRELVSIEIDLTKAPADAIDAYLRLHLLSHRLVKPHGQSRWNLWIAIKCGLD
jgi:2,3,4,5-tetrahydropyridine-2-carboxylate N-succinyltransferase